MSLDFIWAKNDAKKSTLSLANGKDDSGSIK